MTLNDIMDIVWIYKRITPVLILSFLIAAEMDRT